MMIGSVLYAYVLGAICQLVAAMNKSSLEYRETMEEVDHTTRLVPSYHASCRTSNLAPAVPTLHR